MLLPSDKTFNGVIFTDDLTFQKRVESFWPTDNVNWQCYSNAHEATQRILNTLPDILIVTFEAQTEAAKAMLLLVKSENIYRKVPTLACLAESKVPELFSDPTFETDDFFALPGTDDELKKRIALTINRSLRSFDANPLTKLPGNSSIINTVQKLITEKREFSMAYCDLDNFKPFNDKYGFVRGDEVLLMTARLILNTVREVSPKDFFVGHVGGDDFIFVMPIDKVEDVCKKLVRSFDAIVPQFYDEDDRRRGSIVSTDRQGNICTFQLLSISIAVVNNIGGCLQHMGEASQIATNLKKKAKEASGSNYIIDRRSHVTDTAPPVS